jgi:hypothetical protein
MLNAEKGQYSKPKHKLARTTHVAVRAAQQKDTEVDLTRIATLVVLRMSRHARAKGTSTPVTDLSQQRAGVAHIPCGVAALDLREDRLQQRTGIVGRSCLAPETGEVDPSSQLELARLLAVGDVDRFAETSFRSRSVPRHSRQIPDGLAHGRLPSDGVLTTTTLAR